MLGGAFYDTSSDNTLLPSHEILNKISCILFKGRANASGSVDNNRKIKSL